MPNFDGVISTSTSQDLAIGASSYSPNIILMAFKGLNHLSSMEIPELDFGIASADKNLSIRANSN